jgi:uncharacterized membrane protein HdeD (DUF308 family)
MPIRSVLMSALLWSIYPLWLLAGFFDYLSHRRTRIDSTSGPTESWLHLAQMLSLGLPLVLAAYAQITPLVLAILISGVLVHTALAYADVAFTDGRRRISPFEQHVHGFMTVLPIVAVGLVAIAHWDDIRSSAWAVQPRKDSGSRPLAALLVASYFVLAGLPIVEELIRTSRRHRHQQPP